MKHSKMGFSIFEVVFFILIVAVLGAAASVLSADAVSSQRKRTELINEEARQKVQAAASPMKVEKVGAARGQSPSLNDMAQDLAKLEAAHGERERELQSALDKSAREASELKALLAKEQSARQNAQGRQAAAFADLAQSRAGLAVADAPNAAPEQPRWFEIGGAAALGLAALGAVGALALRSRQAP